VGDEFAVLKAMFDGVEMLTNFGYAVGVAYGQDGGGEFFGAEVEVIDGAAGIDKKPVASFRISLGGFDNPRFGVRPE